ncbi:MAG: hypothetical protein Q4D90_04340, partial [bacterium]|nr:hypothetical protein [bacterium]
VPEEADKTVLSAKIAEAENKSEDAYTVESWSVFAKALAEAKAVAENSKAEQETVDAAVKALTEAMDALKEKEVEPEVPEEADKTVLSAKIAEAESKSEEAYTVESWTVFAKALAEAKAVLADEEAVQVDVNAAVKTLISAMDALKEKEVEPEEPDDNTNRRPSHSYGGSSNAQTVINATGSTIGVTSKLTGNVASTTRSGAWKKLPGGNWNLVKENGSTAKNEWAYLNDKTWYLFDNDGKMVQGWANVNNTWYYMDTVNGDMKTGWQLINGKWYYMDAVNGDMKTGWQLINGKWYYLDTVNGDMKTGRVEVNGVWYNLNTDGSWME